MTKRGAARRHSRGRGMTHVVASAGHRDTCEVAYFSAWSQVCRNLGDTAHVSTRAGVRSLGHDRARDTPSIAKGTKCSNMIENSSGSLEIARFFNSLRADLEMPQLPIIQVALASGNFNQTAPADLQTVRSAQLDLGMAGVRCVDAMGFALESDNTHLTTAAQVKLGQLLADAFLQP
ncbi:Domain of unknown function (DUF303 [Striga hermonthica]|uniref:Sialate O-acetylesterase domain-containing protein n=1 Tax=Striga hermonthica TaxID=68872 RepID=A0A9N7R919_STRHE|nr:Domain of unknown function (DUF303 [Striga hermonthica]